MTGYIFDEELFKKNFSVKDDKPENFLKLIHDADKCFKLFPYKTSSSFVNNLGDCISDFFRNALEISAEPVKYENLCNKIQDNMEIEDDDIELLKNIISSLFFKDGNFHAYNIGLYPYQTITDNKDLKRIAEFLYCVLDLDDSDKEHIIEAEKSYSFNVLEKIVADSIETRNSKPKQKSEKYYQIIRCIQKQFKVDFAFMLSSGMTSIEDLTNILSFYYFYYISQSCLVLDQFGNGNRDHIQPLYFALDWEKVSQNRKCCEEGWAKLKNNISLMYSHAITLEIINQNNNPEMLDYIDFKSIADSSEENDIRISTEIKKAESSYVSCIGDCPKINDIPDEEGANRTDGAIRHLFKCVNIQFLETDRKAPHKRYSDKFENFCKVRFIKNRRKSGSTLNLTERDIIFLTKVVIQHGEKIRLNDLYKEYEKRGVYLDSTSRGLLQEFFTKLNLIDKKSDSGDAQYVKRIL